MMMHRILAGLFVAFALPLLAAKRPNILFIYTDDQSTRTVSCYEDGFDFVKTPNIDALARSGVRFSRAYIGSWCMPSRATMLTGHHQHGVESMRMEGKYPGSAYDPDKCPFWPAVLRKHGYETAQIGKWHTGVDGGFGRDWDYQIIWNRPKYVENSPNYYYDQLTEFNGGEPKMVKGYTTDNYTNWAIEFINGKGRTDKNKPWYLWLCYGAVHGPFTPADRHKGDYKDSEPPIPKDVYPTRPSKPQYVRKMEHWEPKNGVPVEKKVRELGPVGMKDIPGRPLREWIKQYHEGVLAIDEGVGRVLRALKDSGQDEDTLVVFTSDQGFAWGQHGFKSKVAPYHSTVAAPLIIRLPGKAAAKTASAVSQLRSGAASTAEGAAGGGSSWGCCCRRWLGRAHHNHLGDARRVRRGDHGLPGAAHPEVWRHLLRLRPNHPQRFRAVRLHHLLIARPHGLDQASLHPCQQHAGR